MMLLTGIPNARSRVLIPATSHLAVGLNLICVWHIYVSFNPLIFLETLN